MAIRAKSENQQVEIKPANLQELRLGIVGLSPYVQLRFTEKAKAKMRDKQQAGSTGKASKARSPRDFEDDFKQAVHVAEDGWYGIPATSFRAAMVDACRTVSMEMTRAKMAIFILHDGLDAKEGTPLVKLVGGEPEMREDAVRNATGVADLRIRAMWRRWSATVGILFDADILTAENVTNLLDRAGRQVGIGEGRPFSKKSVGQGWGTFSVVGNEGGTE